MHISSDDPEVRKIFTTTTQVQERFALPERLKYFSSWHNAKRAVAACLRLQKKFQLQPKEAGQGQTGEVRTSVRKTNQYVPVNTQELQNAEIEIIKAVQSEEFQEETSLLHSDNAQQGSQDHSMKVVKRTSSLYRLNPFLDENGLLRVGGCLKHADLTTAVKHPIILPRKGHVTGLIISHFHNMVEHQGRGMTLNQIRSAGF